MGDYNQQNQKVRRDQYNVEGNINQHRVRGYNQQGQRVTGGQYNAEGNINQYQGDYYHYNNHSHYVENVEGNKAGRDNVGRDVVHNQYHTKVDTSGFKSIGRGFVIVSLLGFLFFAGLIGGGIWFVSSGHLKMPSFGSSPSSSLDQMLYGTPPDALKQFCNHLQSGGLQDAYDVYSSHLKSQISLDQFTDMWTKNPAHTCTSNITNSSDTSASGMIHTTRTTLANGGGFVTSSTDYNVTLVTNNGIWQIDSWSQIS